MTSLSVIIPTHNRPSKLRRAIKSCYDIASPHLTINVIVRNNSSLEYFATSKRVVESFKKNSFFDITHENVSQLGAAVIEADYNIFCSYTQQCTTDFLLVLGDDDAIYGLNAIIFPELQESPIIYSKAYNCSSLELD